jgi:hypothetical protein
LRPQTGRGRCKENSRFLTLLKRRTGFGGSVITLIEKSAATLQRNGEGAHVDLEAGSVYVWSAGSNPLEVHVEGALLRAHGAQQVQAQILMFAPKILQITTRQGSLDFSFGREFRVLPEGQTYHLSGSGG